jgi:hypothetical protein
MSEFQAALLSSLKPRQAMSDEREGPGEPDVAAFRQKIEDATWDRFLRVAKMWCALKPNATANWLLDHLRNDPPEHD